MHIYENVLFIDKDTHFPALRIRLVGISNFNLKHDLIFKNFFPQNILATLKYFSNVAEIFCAVFVHEFSSYTFHLYV